MKKWFVFIILLIILCSVILLTMMNWSIIRKELFSEKTIKNELLNLFRDKVDSLSVDYLTDLGYVSSGDLDDHLICEYNSDNDDLYVRIDVYNREKNVKLPFKYRDYWLDDIYDLIKNPFRESRTKNEIEDFQYDYYTHRVELQLDNIKVLFEDGSKGGHEDSSAIEAELIRLLSD